MPSRNIIKVNLAESYYHAYARGINKQRIFIDTDDYHFFIQLFDRYLSKDNSENLEKCGYQKLNNLVEIAAYCIMPNHFHLLLYQVDDGGMAKLMRGVMTSYSRYFNLKYERRGPLFESRYKASLIDSDEYLLHISRYIHCNHEEWIDYPHTSLRAYLYDDGPRWLNKSRISQLYSSAVNYLDFLNDYQVDRDKVNI